VATFFFYHEGPKDMTDTSPELHALEQRKSLIETKFKQRRDQLEREFDEEIKNIQRLMDGVKQRERQKQSARNLEREQ